MTTPLEKIGLQAVLEDENFQAGLKRYLEGEGKMISSTEQTSSMLSSLGSIAGGALVAGIAAATVVLSGFFLIGKQGFDTARRWGEQLDSLGDQFGFTGEKASGFTFLANKMGLSIDEMGIGLRSLINGLDGIKQAAKGQPQEFIPKGSPEQIKTLNERLADAKIKLERAQKAFADSKKPTDQMRYAIDDAKKSIARINADIADAGTMIPKKMKAAADSATPFQKALTKIGVSAFDSKGKLKTFDALLPELMDKFSKLPAGVNASALAMDLFGTRGGTKFLDFLRQGSKGLADAQKQAEEFGLVVSTKDVNALEEFGFEMNTLKLGIDGVWNQIGIALLPTVNSLLRQFISRCGAADIADAGLVPQDIAHALLGRLPIFEINTMADDIGIDPHIPAEGHGHPIARHRHSESSPHRFDNLRIGVVVQRAIVTQRFGCPIQAVIVNHVQPRILIACDVARNNIGLVQIFRELNSIVGQVRILCRNDPAHAVIVEEGAKRRIEE